MDQTRNRFVDSIMNQGGIKKTAATKEDIKKNLSSLNDDEIQKLAEEILQVTSKKASTTTPEEQATEAARQAGSTKAEDTLAKEKAKNGEDAGAEDAKKESAPKETTPEDTAEDAKREEANVGTSDESDDKEYEVTAAQYLYGILKEAAAEEEAEEGLYAYAQELAGEILKSAEVQEELATEIEKRAFEIAEDILADFGMTKEAFIAHYIGDEKLAAHILETSEKLAQVSDEPFTKIASEVIDNIYKVAGN